jgi:hypothetical protein
MKKKPFLVFIIICFGIISCERRGRKRGTRPSINDAMKILRRLVGFDQRVKNITRQYLK